MIEEQSILLFVDRLFLSKLLDLSPNRQIQGEEHKREQQQHSAENQVAVGEVTETLTHV